MPYWRPVTTMKALFPFAVAVFAAACSASSDAPIKRTSPQAASAATAVAPGTPAADTSGRRVPDSVLRACDLIAEIAARPRGVTVGRSAGPFDDEREHRTRFGCSVSLDGSTKALGGTPNPFDLLREQFAARGWHEDADYSADGPDGTAFAFVRDDVICIFRGTWDGGDDADPSYTPGDAFRGAGHCALTEAPKPPGQT